MVGGHPNIPHIAVTTDFASTHSLHSPDDDGKPPNNLPLIIEYEQTSPESDLFPPSPATPQSSGLLPFHAVSPSDPAFLSPFGKSPTAARMSLDVPPRSSSPSYASSHEGSSTMAPPSPTLSTQSSVHFATSVALRENKPGDGTSSLGLLHTDRSIAKHGRKASWASSGEGHSSLEGTEPDHGGIGLSSLHRVTSAATSLTAESPTQTHVDNLSERSRSRSRSRIKNDSADSDRIIAISETDGRHSVEHRNRGKGQGIEDPSNARLDLEQDPDDVNPAPFAFKPFALASMLDPKNLEVLEGLGGVQGLLKGLGTSRTHGLKINAPIENADVRPGPGEGASQRHDREDQDALPGILVTAPSELESNTSDDEDDDNEYDDDPVWSTSLEQRRRVYGHNVLPHRTTKSLLALMWLALKDKVLVLLSIAAVVSLALGLFQDFGTPRPANEPPVDWVEGVAIMAAIFIVVMVGSINDWQKERQFQVLNEKKDERGVKVIRNGVEMIIDIKDVVVGDIALLEPGEIVPCDGIFLSGHNVKCDESGATGESDAIKKVSYDECLALRQKAKQAEGADGGVGHIGNGGMGHTDCFVVSGSKVLEGVGSYVVVAVGTKSFNGRIMIALRTDAANTPLQLKLNALAELIAKLGSAAGLILFVALMIRFFVQLGTGEPQRTANQKGIAFTQILIISVTLIVVAVPEGLPLAVTLALAFATKRMTYEKLLVRVLGSCETMANASVVCTDKTGTLTQNMMTVVAGSIGIHAKFVRKLEDNQTRTNAEEEHCEDSPKPPGTRKHPNDFSIDQTDLNNVLSPQLQDLLNTSIAVNSTAFEDADPETGEAVFVGNKTETALLKLAKELGWTDYKKMRDSARVLQMIPFSSERKAMGVVVKLDGRARLYLKGASEILSKKCTRRVVVSQDAGDQKGRNEVVEAAEIDGLASDNISRTIIFYANQTLRTIALCYRDFDSWPPRDTESSPDNEVAYDDLARDMTLIGIIGIEDPLRDGVREAVAKCHMAGVTVKMCTGDNVLTARSIALQSGIYTPGGIIMEGPFFRQLSDAEMIDVVPRLQVLARSSPEDKKILVEKLKLLGEIVGVTGDGTNDGPALKTADVGFSMGIAGTEVSKEASDIILMDDNFSSIVKAIMWGRCVNDAVRKFLQFQVTTNVTAVVITFVTAVASASESSVLSAVQLLWINLIMDTFAALALATDPASESLLDRKPVRKTAPLFSVQMYKQILFQSTYQIIVTLIFHFLGLKILGLEASTKNDAIVQTLVFNAFVFAQIFNSINCRRLDNRWNVFEGMIRNYYFIGITLIEMTGQILIVFIGGAAFQVTRINGREWAISLALGVVSLPLGFIARLIPDAPFEKLFIKLRLLQNPEILPTTRPDGEWNFAINRVRDSLGMFANVRGGRVHSSPFVIKSRSARLQDGPERPTLPSLMTMVPTLVASSIGAGWAPQPGSLSDPAHTDPSKSSAALWEGKIQIHPDTKPDDPAYKRWGTPRSAHND